MRSDRSESFRQRLARRGQGGVTLIELVVVIAVVSIVMVSLSAWMITTIAAQSRAREASRDANTIALVNASLLRDVSSAMFATGTFQKSPGQLPDCPTNAAGDSSEGAGQVQLALVTPGNRRVVYTLVDAEPGSGDVGKVLYRRDCANLKSISAAATTYPATETVGDPTLNDPETRFLNDPKEDDLTTPTRAKRITDGLLTFDSSCPLTDSPATTQDPNCTTVKVVAKLFGRTDKAPMRFQGTRRTDTYCAPDCPPVAAFTYSPDEPTKNLAVSFDASTSYDRRGAYYPDEPPKDPKETRLHYSWWFDSEYSEGENACGSEKPADKNGPNDPPDATVYNPQHTYVVANGGNCGHYRVTLMVTNSQGKPGWVKRDIVIPGKRPIAQITNQPVPYRVVRNQPVQFTSQVQTFEGNLDESKSFWDFGDGVTLPLVAAASSPATPTCSDAAAPLCTTSTHSPLFAGFSTIGIHNVRLVVTDTTGLRTEGYLAVDVVSEFYYASQSYGADTPTCGPYTEPCLTITMALAHAYNDDKSDVLVGQGTYDSFAMVNGINVAGGRDDSAGVDSTWVYDASKVTTIPGRIVGTERVALTATSLSKATMVSDLTLAPGNPADTDMPVQAAIVDGSTNFTFRNVKANGGNGRNATGILVRNASNVSIVKSAVTSGTPIMPSNAASTTGNRSAYGVRVMDGSSVTIDNSTIDVADGLAGKRGDDAPNSPPGAACRGANGVTENTSNGSSCNPGAGDAAGGYGGGGGGGGSFFGRGSDGRRGGNGGGGALGGGLGGGGYCLTPHPGVGGPGRGGAGGSGAPTGGAGGVKSAANAGVLWDSTQAGTGGGGNPGGGGGGAGGGGGTYCAGAASGGRGPGGGGGGTGGTIGGQGGWSGGGSFGVYANDSEVNVVNGSTIRPGKGGAGGQGGKGSAGGMGGDGGNGAHQGKGGDTGGGGGGGGGQGASGGGGGSAGPSIAVFKSGTGTVPNVAVGNTLTPKSGTAVGAGGLGGDGASGGSGGSQATGVCGGFGQADCTSPGDSGSVGSPGTRGENGKVGFVCAVYTTVGGGADCLDSTITSITRQVGSPSLTNATTVSWTVTFKVPVTNVTASNFATNLDGVTASPTLVLTPVSDTVYSDTVYTVTASAVTGNGTIGLNAIDVAGIRNAGSGVQIADPSPLPFPGELYQIDQVAPTVTSIVRVGPKLTNSNLVSWMVTFSEPVSYVGGSNFSFVSGGTVSGAAISSVYQSVGTTWVVDATTGTGSGPLTLNLSANQHLILDPAGNHVPFTTTVGETYDIDKTPPEVSSIVRETGAPNPTNATTLNWTVTFSEPVFGLSLSNFSLTAASVAGSTPIPAGVLTNMTGGGATYTVTATNVTGDGTLALNLTSGFASVQDAATNLLAGPAPAGEAYRVDQVAPTVVSIVRATADPTNAPVVSWTVTFSEAVSGVDIGNFTLQNTNLVSPNLVSPVIQLPTGAGAVWTVSATTGNSTNSGNLGLNLDTALSSIIDWAGNSLVTAPAAGEVFLVDKTAPPTVTDNSASGTLWANNASTPVTITVDATDNPLPGRSGIGSIRYWKADDGSAAPAPSAFLTAGNLTEITPGRSTATFTVPYSDPGNWTIWYYALDNVGNQSAIQSKSFGLRLDDGVPTVSITSPVNAAMLSSSGTIYTTGGTLETAYSASSGITGTVTDPPGTLSANQSGATVKVLVKRNETNQYWNGSTYTADPVLGAITATLTGTPTFATWAISPFTFPAGGSWTITASAVDLATNAATPRTSSFDIDYKASTAVFVSSTSGNDANNGLCPSTGMATCTGGPKATISAGVTAANGDPSRSEVLVAAGTYTETVNATIGGRILNIRGGYGNAAFGSAGAWVRNAPGSNTVTVNGPGTGVVVTGQRVNGTWGGARLEQLTVTPTRPTFVLIEGTDYNQPAPNANWGGSSPRSGVRADDFSVRYTTTFTANYTGNFAVSSTTNDGGRAFITPAGGVRTLLGSNWLDHATASTAIFGGYTVTNGVSYTLEYEVYEHDGDAMAHLSPSVPSTPLWGANSFTVQWYNDAEASSYGVRAVSTVGTAVVNSVVTAASGNRGLLGVDGGSSPGADGGGAGFNGFSNGACTGSNPGGGGGGPAPNNGGWGGWGATCSGNAGDGGNGSGPGFGGGGTRGSSQICGGTSTGGFGGAGGAGAVGGSAGTPGDNLADATWSSGSGTNGVNGGDGSGGGGGGGGGGGAGIGGCSGESGGSGGGGGGGGHGGSRGTAGTGGGGSFGIYQYNSLVSVTNSTIAAQDGGDGGFGGKGGDGGWGGWGGNGGAGVGDASGGGGGGSGGGGGGGGGGAGGNGGPSFGVYNAVAGTVSIGSGVTITFASGGDPGTGGAGGWGGRNGLSGGSGGSPRGSAGTVSAVQPGNGISANGGTAGAACQVGGIGAPPACN